MNDYQRIEAENIVNEILELVKEIDWESIHTYEKKFFKIQKLVRGVTKLQFEDEDNINISKAIYKKFLFLIDPHAYKYKEHAIKKQDYQGLINFQKNNEIPEYFVADGLISKEKYDNIIDILKNENLSGLNDFEIYEKFQEVIDDNTDFEIGTDENLTIASYILFNSNIVDTNRRPEFKSIEIETRSPYSERITIMDACFLAIRLFDKFETLSDELLQINILDYLDKLEKNPQSTIYDDISVEDEYDESSYIKIDVNLYNFIIRAIKLNKEFVLIYNVDPDNWEECINEYFDFFMKYNNKIVDDWITNNRDKIIDYNASDFENETSAIFDFLLYKMGRVYMDLIESISEKVDEYINTKINQ